jgi:hypothetical protein
MAATSNLLVEDIIVLFIVVLTRCSAENSYTPGLYHRFACWSKRLLLVYTVGSSAAEATE